MATEIEKKEYRENLDRLLAEFRAKKKEDGENTTYEPQKDYVRPLTAEEKADKPDHEKRKRQNAAHADYKARCCPRCGSPACGNDCIAN